ncbi:MAG: hypothetical protein ACYTFY_09495 [Planctomycetota bacterium]|jgi:hypothetical protein
MNNNFYYAPSEKHIYLAAENNIKNVIVDSRGHHSEYISGLQDNQLCLMPGLEKVYALRKKHSRAVKQEIKNVNNRIEMAVSCGLKPYIHSYELSFPAELKEKYPDLFVKMTSEHRKCSAACQRARILCLSDKRIRNLVSDKIEEIVANFSGLAGYIYSNHESQLARYSHFCDACKDLDRTKLIKWLYEAVKAGAERVNPDLVIMPRLWGITHCKDMYYKVPTEMVKLCDNDPSCKGAKVLTALKKEQFKPDTVNPKLPGIIAEKDKLVYKATWGDYNLNQPLNKWAKKYGKTEQVVEISLEHCLMGRHIPLIVSRQHQKMIKSLKGKNVSFAVVPLPWGRVYLKPGSTQEVCLPEKWGLNFLNLSLLLKLLKNPDIDLIKETQKLLKEKYGEKLPVNLAKSLFDAETIISRSINILGVSTIMNIDCILRERTYSLIPTVNATLWYASMIKKGKQCISTSDSNMKKIFKEKDKAVLDAEKLYQKVTDEINKISNRKLKSDTVDFFTKFNDLAEYSATTRKRLWIQYKLQKEKAISYNWTRQLDELIEEEKRIIANSDYISGIYNKTHDIIFEDRRS